MFVRPRRSPFTIRKTKTKEDHAISTAAADAAATAALQTGLKEPTGHQLERRQANTFDYDLDSTVTR